MNKQRAQRLQANDFVMAMKEMSTYIDVTVDDLMELHQRAEKFARLRDREDILVEKLMTYPVITVQPDCILSDAAHLMMSNKISGLAVVDDKNKIVGIITEADFLRALGVPSHQPGHSVWQTLENMFGQPVQVCEPDSLVTDLMNNNVITITPQQSLYQVLDVMKKNRVKRIVVCDETQHVVGMITRSDLVRMFFDHFNPANYDSKKVKAI